MMEQAAEMEEVVVDEESERGAEGTSAPGVWVELKARIGRAIAWFHQALMMAAWCLAAAADAETSPHVGLVPR